MRLAAGTGNVNQECSKQRVGQSLVLIEQLYVEQITRSRAHRNAGEHWHWAKVASEVARIEPRAAMDFEVVKALRIGKTLIGVEH